MRPIVRSNHPGAGRDPFRPWAPAFAGVDAGYECGTLIGAGVDGDQGSRRLSPMTRVIGFSKYSRIERRPTLMSPTSAHAGAQRKALGQVAELGLGQLDAGAVVDRALPRLAS